MFFKGVFSINFVSIRDPFFFLKHIWKPPIDKYVNCCCPCVCPPGSPTSPLGPWNKLHCQGHQRPPGFRLRLREGGPPQVCGHQDVAVGERQKQNKQKKKFRVRDRTWPTVQLGFEILAKYEFRRFFFLVILNREYAFEIRCTLRYKFLLVLHITVEYCEAQYSQYSIQC